MRMGFDFKGEFHQFGIYTVSATFGINRPFFKKSQERMATSAARGKDRQVRRDA
jgi:hypothetical protein